METTEALQRQFEKQLMTAVFNDPVINPTGEQVRRLVEIAGKIFNAIVKEPQQAQQPDTMTDDDAKARLAYLNTIHASRKWKPAQKDAYINLYNEAQRNRDRAIDGYAPVIATGRELAARLDIPRGVADNIRVQFRDAGILKLLQEDRYPVDRHGNRLTGRSFNKKLGDRWENIYTYGMRLDPYGTLPDLKRTKALDDDVARKEQAKQQQAEDVKKMMDELTRLRQLRCPACGQEQKPGDTGSVFSVRCNKCGAIFDDQHPPEYHEHKPNEAVTATAPAGAHDGTESRPPCTRVDSPGLSPHGGMDSRHQFSIGGSDLGHRDGGMESEPPREVYYDR